MIDAEYFFTEKRGTVKAVRDLNIRKGKPSISAELVKCVPKGTTLEYFGWVENGVNYKNISKWYRDGDGNYFWSGNVMEDKASTVPSPKFNIGTIRFDSNPLDELICTQKFGLNPDMYSKYGMKGHNGIDFRTKTAVDPDGHRKAYAVMDGRVSQAVEIVREGYGKNVRLRHDGDSETIYAHLFSLNVRAGQLVKAGDLLGICGNSSTPGASTGPHLHFGYRPVKNVFDYNNGYKGWIDPESFFLGPITFV